MYDWNKLGRVWRDSRRQVLWRSHSDAVNRALVERWVPQRPIDILLKTDAFDEAFGEGLLGALGGRVRSVVAIDISNEVLEAARARDRTFTGVQADVRRLPLPDNSIDVVISISTLDHFDSPEEIAAGVRELARVLRPDGVLILTMDNPSNPIVRLRNALPMSWLLRSGVVPYQVGVTANSEQLRELLASCGFESIETRSILHCPRLLAVPIAGLLDRFCGLVVKGSFLRLLIAMERLAKLPTRRRTGHFVAIRGVKAR
jgi:SAM-dependent methyltransferase